MGLPSRYLSLRLEWCDKKVPELAGKDQDTHDLPVYFNCLSVCGLLPSYLPLRLRSQRIRPGVFLHQFGPFSALFSFLTSWRISKRVARLAWQKDTRRNKWPVQERAIFLGDDHPWLVGLWHHDPGSRAYRCLGPSFPDSPNEHHELVLPTSIGLWRRCHYYYWQLVRCRGRKWR